jgi:hypothetical protein
MDTIALPAIYVDQDDVLAEFYGTAGAILGAPFQSLTPAVRWGQLERVERLFRYLPVRPDALALWHGLEGRGNRSILTAMPRPTGLLHTAAADKLEWAREYITATAPVIVAESGLAKAAWARPGAVLIDNLQRNIDVWVAAGGIGVVHTSAADTLAQLDALGITRKSA